MILSSSEYLYICKTRHGIINSTNVGGNQSRKKSLCADLVALVLSRDENSALRLITSSRDEISLLSLSLVSHENHRRRRLLECRSPLLFLFCSSTSIDDHHLLLLFYSILPQDHIIFSLSIVLLQPHSILLSFSFSLIFPLFLPFQFSLTLP